jgi:hypothetical protein
MTSYDLLYRKDRDMYRVWRPHWMGDQFEVLNQVEFETLELVAKRFSYSMCEIFDDE